MVPRRPRNTQERLSYSLITLTVLAVLAAMYFARPVLVPIAVAVVLALVLMPIVLVLERRLRLPRPLAALGTVAIVVGSIGLAGYHLVPPAADWAAQLPSEARNIQEKLRPLTDRVEKISATAEQVEQMTTLDESPAGLAVSVQDKPVVRVIFERVQSVGFLVLLTIALVYFLLAAGDHFVFQVIAAANRPDKKRNIADIAETIRAEIGYYFLTITLINAGLGVATGVTLWLVGMPNPVLWGVMAGVFNFVPYLGAIVGVGVVTLVALITFDSLSPVLLASGTYLGLTVVEGNIVTPLVLGRRMTLNPVVVFVSLIFWGWIWGVPGAFLAVPFAVSLKIVCDRVPRLQTIGVLLGDDAIKRDQSSESVEPAGTASANTVTT